MDLGDIRGRESEGVEFIRVLEKYHLFLMTILVLEKYQLFIPDDNPGPRVREISLDSSSSWS